MGNEKNNELIELLNNFNAKCQNETLEIRENSENIQVLIEKEQKLLEQLNSSSFFLRIFNFILGRTAKFERLSRMNYVKMQQINIVLITAIMRQNRIIMDGIKLTFDKINEIDQETKQLKKIINSNFSEKKGIFGSIGAVFRKFFRFFR